MILCVLRGGGEYGPEHVARLAGQIRAHGGGELACLTDMPEVLGIVADVRALRPEELSWRGWWAKLAALRLPGPILYLDLDVTVVGDLAPLLELAGRVDFAMCRGFWGSEDPNPLNSSVMAWRADAPSHLRELFSVAPDVFMARHEKMPGARTRWGDQGFIAEHYGAPVTVIQDELPGAIVSFKRGVLRGEDMSRCAVCVSHGKPRPWETGGADQWMAKINARRMAAAS